MGDETFAYCRYANHFVPLLKAILDKATTHTKSLLQKSEERAKALEKVSHAWIFFSVVIIINTVVFYH